MKNQNDKPGHMQMVVNVPYTPTRVVVVYDMCSSSTIMEDLILSGNIRKYWKFIVHIKRWLSSQAAAADFVMYQFTGDGWILLFPENTDGTTLLRLLSDLCTLYKNELDTQIVPYLEHPPEVMGITIGLDKGPLNKMKLRNRKEFVGRAINIAYRLQSAVKEEAGSPAYKALVSNQVYNDYLLSVNEFETRSVERRLRNIHSNATFKCIEIDFTRKKGN